MIEMLSYDFMQRALLAAVVVGTISPLIGVFLVQRRLALLGDGMGHVALTGVGLAFLVGTAPVPTALVLAAIGAVVLEIIRSRSRTAGPLPDPWLGSGWWTSPTSSPARWRPRRWPTWAPMSSSSKITAVGT